MEPKLRKFMESMTNEQAALFNELGMLSDHNEVEKLREERNEATKQYSDCCKYAKGWRDRADGWLKELNEAESQRDALRMVLKSVYPILVSSEEDGSGACTYCQGKDGRRHQPGCALERVKNRVAELLPDGIDGV